MANLDSPFWNGKHFPSRIKTYGYTHVFKGVRVAASGQRLLLVSVVAGTCNREASQKGAGSLC